MTGGVIKLPAKVTAQIPLRYPWSILEEKTALVAAASQDVGLQPDTNAPVAPRTKTNLHFPTLMGGTWNYRRWGQGQESGRTRAPP
jgi:hypothetical protein